MYLLGLFTLPVLFGFVFCLIVLGCCIKDWIEGFKNRKGWNPECDES